MTRIRVLVVDDSVVVRRLVADALAGEPQIDVIGTAANGHIALTKIEQLAPDLVTMDIEMPVMDGIETVRALRRRGDKMPIIMFSTLTERGASATFDALAAGATDYVTKPANQGSVAASLAKVAEDLVPLIKALVPHPGAGRPTLPRTFGAPRPAPATAAPGGAAGPARANYRTAEFRAAPAAASSSGAITLAPRSEPRPVRLVIVGSSTGGPEALSRMFQAITSPLPVPMVLVQHMPPVFTRQLAARLDRLGATTVVESAGDEELLPGHAYIAPGDRHLELRQTARGARTFLSDGPPVNFCRPAVDILFRSAVTAFGGDLLAVVLTGMGADGRTGCEAVVGAGGTVMVQDEASSVVWGMPGAVAMAGFAHRILPLDQVGAALVGSVLKSALDPTGGSR
ncbi:protein-glutamate methylesterase/protein-glutamine glutaminase [Pengzhenrongella frigida]|uniref:Protein-glutamate methylesterase/protein-glutamine glutaminase n=1 Tax=Pengzhenrongella frigida TaxID=1259133 RepID=A0A4Q5N038_9MICO|nr:chemotaxis response regulator protein-glutamate methylesterase [Cellulomonas sp. HLT2-17]RYV49351.1 chemotaxis response regulator protein-glutamate methylesterase [Cellulomonas sp. HLT2-17]